MGEAASQLLARVPQAAAHRRRPGPLQLGGLEGGVGRDAGDLSGGQKNRVALARALYRAGARVLLLDEPTAALDAAARAVVDADLRAWALSEGGSSSRILVVATHDAEEAARLGAETVAFQ